MNHLSLELSKKLSSLVPEMEGHYYWYSEFTFQGRAKKTVLIGEPWVMCEEAERGGENIGEFTGKRICPAWQVEDLLRNLDVVIKNVFRVNRAIAVDEIAKILTYQPDTAYQKIEEYLWEILK